TTAQAPRPRAPGRGGAPCPHRPGRRPPMTHRFRTEDGMEMRSIERPRKQRIAVITVALILAAVAVAGTIRAFRADHRPAGEGPAVAGRIRGAGADSAVAGTLRALRAQHRPAAGGPPGAGRVRRARRPSAHRGGPPAGR